MRWSVSFSNHSCSDYSPCAVILRNFFEYYEFTAFAHDIKWAAVAFSGRTRNQSGVLEGPLPCEREPNYYAPEPLSGQSNNRYDLIRGLAISPREHEVLTLIAEGLADKEIAEATGISRFTVNKHVRSLLCKLEAVSRTQAAVKALKLGLID